MLKIVYIIGTGRSGSTLIDVVLGNSGKVVSTGEIYDAINAQLRNKLCSCGVKLRDCPFWSQVSSHYSDALETTTLYGMHEIHRRLERSALAPLRIMLRKILRLKDVEDYKRFLDNLYAALRTVSGKSVIVDSSKNPLRGYLLSLLDSTDVYYIHLVRDGRAALWSWMRTGTIPPFGIPIRKHARLTTTSESKHYWYTPWLYSMSWVAYNLATQIVLRLIKKKCARIQYEQFVANPSRYIDLIGDLIDEDLSDLRKLIESSSPLEIDHVISGNQLRLARRITLRPADDDWNRKLPDSYKKVFWMCAGWLARSYGYGH